VNEHTEQNMADETTVGETTAVVATPQHTPSEHAAGAHPQRSEALAFAIGVAGWLVPGLGHALQKMWGRALGCFLTVGALVFLGVGMRGNLFSSEGGDAFGILGYVADLGTGSFYFAARALETQGSDVAHAEGDYGTRFLAAAGVLNLLAALHAYEAARGRKA
jgi:drug/metabolite transporter (DMT)-like permease